MKNKAFKNAKGAGHVTRLLIFSSSFLILPLFFAAGDARAYDIENQPLEKSENTFVVTPLKLELDLAQGETTTGEMVVVNRLGRTATFKIEIEDFKGSEDPDKSTDFLEDKYAEVTTARDWIKPEATEIVLNQGDRLTLPYEITVPAKTTAGSHYAAIIASPMNEGSAEGEKQVKTVTRVALLNLINVKGENKEKGEITEFKSDKPFYKTGPIGFSTVFKNDGNVYEKVKGDVTIRNIIGSEVGKIPVKEWIVLSESSRRQKAEWNKKWLLGIYTAELDVSYGIEKEFTESKTFVFYAFPWHVAIPALFGLYIIFWLGGKIFSRVEVRIKGKKR